MSNTSDSFIKLDRHLIRAIGLTNAIILCNFRGLEKRFNTSDAIYQQKNRIAFNTGLTEQTIDKHIKELEKLKLLHTSKKRGVKNRYRVNVDNYNLIINIEKELEQKIDIENEKTRKQLEKETIKLYLDTHKNTSATTYNFISTKRDLNKRDLTKKINSSHHFVDLQKDAITIKNKKYYYIPLLFKTSDEVIIKDILKKYDLDVLSDLEYFLESYYFRYNKLHRVLDADKVDNLIKHLEYSIKMYDLYDASMLEIIDEYFKINNKDDLSLNLFLSHNNTDYTFIENLTMRIM